MEGLLLLDAYKADAVISISEFNECPKRAIQSVIANAKYFSGLHIVQYGYSTTAPLYAGWQADLEQLKELQLAPIWHSTLDVSKVKGQAVIHITPDVQVLDGALEMLYTDMIAGADYYDHFAVSTNVQLNTKANNNWRNPQKLWDALLNGFLLVVLALDLMRSALTLGRYHRTIDLRAQTIQKGYPKRASLAGNRWWAWIFFTRICPIKEGGKALVQLPTGASGAGGAGYLLRTIKTHNHMGFGICWLLLLAVHYFLFAYPWWQRLVLTTPVQPASYLDMILSFGLTPALEFLLTVVHSVWLLIYVWYKMELPLYSTLPLALAYPFYLAVSPIVFVWGRYHTSKAGWSKESD